MTYIHKGQKCLVVSHNGVITRFSPDCTIRPEQVITKYGWFRNWVRTEIRVYDPSRNQTVAHFPLWDYWAITHLE